MAAAGNSTSIGWTNRTLTIAVGCTRVGKNTECDHCYAVMDGTRRADWSKKPHYLYEGVLVRRSEATGRADWTGRVNVDLGRLEAIKHLPAGCMCFLNSLSDTFHTEITDDQIRAMFAAMAARPDVVFQVLTKRSARALALAPSLPWPENIWMGVTVGVKTSLHRLDDLRGMKVLGETGPKVRFVSAEPLVEELDLEPWLADGTLTQVLVGGESKSGFRPLDDDWVRKIRDACKKDGRDVRLFFKQRAGRKPEKKPELDGRTWLEQPPLPQAVADARRASEGMRATRAEKSAAVRLRQTKSGGQRRTEADGMTRKKGDGPRLTIRGLDEAFQAKVKAAADNRRTTVGSLIRAAVDLYLSNTPIPVAEDRLTALKVEFEQRFAALEALLPSAITPSHPDASPRSEPELRE